MKIKGSKNLRYDSFPVDHFEGFEKFESSNCILREYHIIDDKIELHFKNGSIATLRSKNIQGDSEIGMIGRKLANFVDKSYEEILNASF